MSFDRIAFIAYEPWETAVAEKFLQKKSAESPQASYALVVADPLYPTKNRDIAELEKNCGLHPYELFFVFRDLLTWQQEIVNLREPEVEKRLSRLVRLEKIPNIETLIRSDVHLSPRERFPFYSRLNKIQRNAAALLALERTVEIMDSFRPDVVVMMKDQYLVKNFVGRIAPERGIQLRIFRRTRFQDFLKLDYFFLPSDRNARSLKSPRSKFGLREEIAKFGVSLYPKNIALEANDFIRRCGSHPIPAAIETLRNGYRKQVELHRRLKRSSRITEARNMRFWASRPQRVRLWLGLRTLRTLRYIVGGSFFRSMDDLPSRFIVVPLHNRPEASILTRGNGIEDEDVVQAVALALETLRSKLVCVVLEHPAMIKDRRHSFYKALLRLPNVVIADPAESTQRIIGQAAGLVTTSGTAGLEASLAGIPVHVAGLPEYVTAIKSHGFHNIHDFVEQCVAGSAPVSRTEVINYLEGHCDQDWRGELDWGAIQTAESLERTVDTLINMFNASLEAQE